MTTGELTFFLLVFVATMTLLTITAALGPHGLRPRAHRHAAIEQATTVRAEHDDVLRDALREGGVR